MLSSILFLKVYLNFLVEYFFTLLTNLTSIQEFIIT